MADIGDGGDLLIDVLLDATKCSPYFPSVDAAYMSLNALTGTTRNRCIQLRALVNNQVLLVLIDSESSHMFINSATVTRFNCIMTPCVPMEVKVANGNVLVCDQEVPKLNWWTQGHTFQVDAKVIPIGAYDLIFGMDWLELFRPMNLIGLRSGVRI